jgi:hypothetical protein
MFAHIIGSLLAGIAWFFTLTVAARNETKIDQALLLMSVASAAVTLAVFFLTL